MLRAVTSALPPGAPVDPFRLAGDGGFLYVGGGRSLAGRGAAAVLELPGGVAGTAEVARVPRRLGEIAHDDRLGRPGAGLLAFGALPFGRAERGRLVVPSLLYGSEPDGTEWVTVVQPGDVPPPGDLRGRLEELATGPRPAPGPSPGRLERLVELRAPVDYPEAVARAVRAIAGGTLRKVVLARFVEALFAEPPDAGTVLGRLHRDEPSCTAFSVPTPDGQFVGASPELLIARHGRSVSAHPLAGTVGRSEHPGADAEGLARLLASGKDRSEHEYVVAEIAEQLGSRCTTLDVPSSPTLVPLHSVAHLGTAISGQLRATGGTVPSALDLVAALHPTPAVGGVPRDEALGLMAALEAGPRGHWAGPVGWVDAAGDGEWVIGIRSVTLAGRRVRLCAGAGIVADSDPAAELHETTVKLRPVLDALAPGAAVLLAG